MNFPSCLLALCAAGSISATAAERPGPNIVVILADDLGFGDTGCYGATAVPTPHTDRLAAQGRRFRHAHAPSATCTPSRYSLLTGEYAWRQTSRKNAILRGNDPLCIAPGRPTLPALLREAGYVTGVVGKWHLGLGEAGAPVDFNHTITPGPREIGFDESFIIPATTDRVPTVFIEGDRVIGADPADPISVSYLEKIGHEPTGIENPGLLRQRADPQHSGTIVNGISRIGWMTGGRAARWVDEDIAGRLADRARQFIDQHRDKPFFLYFSSHQPHVPRVPHARFSGSTKLGPRGDAIAEFDWTVGEVLHALDRAGVADNTLVILSSDNGSVVFDGYLDQSAELNGDHRPAGGLRGGKYHYFEGGTRVPFIVRWPGHVPAGSVDDRLVCLTDVLATCAALARQPLPAHAGVDSIDQTAVFLGRPGEAVRADLVEHATSNTFALRDGRWKFIPGSKPPPPENIAPEFRAVDVRHRDSHVSEDTLYDLHSDPGETENLATRHPERTEAMRSRLAALLRAP